MTQEEKDLLLKDLCAREPYHPRISVFNDGYEGFQNGEFDTNLWLHHIDAFRFDRIEIWPYLRPMSSMTKKEKEEIELLCDSMGVDDEGNAFYYIIISLNHIPKNISLEVIDWLFEHHFDVHGLIEKGLALEAPEGMYE